MTARLRATILGCGSSAGVPRIGGDWGDCDPENPKNRRSRCSLLVERISGKGVTRALIDTSPDLRAQLLAAGVGLLDGVVYTHPHADHLHGIDDLRVVVQNRRGRLPVWADAETAEVLISRFAYVFVQPAGSLYPPILELRALDGPFVVDGAGGPIPFRPFRAQHGRIEALGFRIRDFAYLPDVSEIPDATWPELAGLETWVLDALRRKPHPTHTHLAQSLEWIARAEPRLGVLTNMHNDLDYATLAAELPEGVVPAFDGFEIEIGA
jgi:phosphoribosyl 1,2-cyclic phosphate phosphodiesterase